MCSSPQIVVTHHHAYLGSCSTHKYLPNASREVLTIHKNLDSDHLVKGWRCYSHLIVGVVAAGMALSRSPGVTRLTPLITSRGLLQPTPLLWHGKANFDIICATIALIASRSTPIVFANAGRNLAPVWNVVKP